MARTFKASGKLDLDTKNFETKSNAVIKKMGNIGRSGEKSFRSLSRTATRFGSDLMSMSALPLAGVLLGFKKLVDAGGDLKDLSTQLNISTSALSELSYAGSMVGLSMQDISQSIEKMEKGIGSGSSESALKKLGLDKETLDKQSPEKNFEEILNRIGKISNQNTKIDLMQQIFGKSSGKMLRMVEMGSAGMQELRKEAQLMGLSIGDDTANKLDDLGDNWDKLNGRIQGFKNTLAIQLAPSLTKVMETLSNVAVKLGEFTNKHPELVKWVTLGGTGLLAFATTLGAVIFTFGKFFSIVSGGFGALKTFAGWIGKITKAKKELTVATEALTRASKAGAVVDALTGGVGGGAGGAAGKRGFLRRAWDAIKDPLVTGAAGGAAAGETVRHGFSGGAAKLARLAVSRIPAGLAIGATGLVGWGIGKEIDRRTADTAFGRQIDRWSDSAAIVAYINRQIFNGRDVRSQLTPRAKELLARKQASDDASTKQMNALLSKQNELLKQIANNTKTQGNGNKMLVPAI